MAGRRIRCPWSAGRLRVRRQAARIIEEGLRAGLGSTTLVQTSLRDVSKFFHPSRRPRPGVFLGAPPALAFIPHKDAWSVGYNSRKPDISHSCCFNKFLGSLASLD